MRLPAGYPPAVCTQRAPTHAPQINATDVHTPSSTRHSQLRSAPIPHVHKRGVKQRNLQPDSMRGSGSMGARGSYKDVSTVSSPISVGIVPVSCQSSSPDKCLRHISPTCVSLHPPPRRFSPAAAALPVRRRGWGIAWRAREGRALRTVRCRWRGWPDSLCRRPAMGAPDRPCPGWCRRYQNRTTCR